MIHLTVLKNCIMNNLTIKILSMIIGYALWSLLADSYTVTQWQTIPICFYNVSENRHIESNQEQLKIKLSGKRSDLISCKSLAFHVDAQLLSKGQNILMPNESSLFLPTSVKLVYCNPIKVSVNA